MHFPRILRPLVPGLVVAALAVPAVSIQAQQSHLVSPTQLQQQVQTSTTARQQNIETLNQFLSTPTAEKAMKDAKVDATQVKTAIPTLSDAELANLSARAQHAQSQFAAGGLSTLALALIIIAVVLIILLAAYH